MQLEFSLDRPEPGTQRPRGRTERVRSAVLAATRDQLVAHGYAGLTVERVADAAGVAKSTVYRRWRDPAGLLAEQLRDQIRTDIPLADSGSVDLDLQSLAVGIARYYAVAANRAFMMGLIAAAVTNPRVAQTLHEFFQVRNDQAADAVRRGIERGELPADTDAVEVIRALGAPFYYRMLVTHEPIDETVGRHAATLALAAARAGALRILDHPSAATP